MKLDNEKIDKSGYYKIGYDKYSDHYIMETNDGCGNIKYYIITEQQYIWYDVAPEKLKNLYDECVRKNIHSKMFFFSNWERENSDSQNELMWKYDYRELLIGKSIGEVHKIIGNPDKVIEEGKKEYFKMNSQIHFFLKFINNKCCDIKYSENI